MAKNDNETLCGVLTYLLVGIIWFFVDEHMLKSDFVRFHVRQAVALFILGVIFAIASMALVFITLIGPAISLAFNICLLILWLIGIVGALQGKKREIPIVGSLAKSFAF